MGVLFSRDSSSLQKKFEIPVFHIEILDNGVFESLVVFDRKFKFGRSQFFYFQLSFLRQNQLCSSVKYRG